MTSKWYVTISLVVCGFTCAAVAQAQRCPLPMPTFLDDVRAENVRTEQTEVQQEAAAPRMVRVTKVDLESTSRLSPALEGEVLADVIGRTYNMEDKTAKIGSEMGGTPKWAEEIAERIRYAFQEHGHFRALIGDPKIFAERESGNTTDVRLLFAIDPGAVYRLGEVTFQHGTVFAPERLRALFDARSGDLFDVDQIRKGLDRIRKIYGAKGYVNVTPIPDTLVRANEPTVDLVIDVDEGRQLRIGELEFIGVHAEELRRLAEQHGLRPGTALDDALTAFRVEADKKGFLTSYHDVEQTNRVIHDTYVSVDLRIGAPVCPTETSAAR